MVETPSKHKSIVFNFYPQTSHIFFAPIKKFIFSSLNIRLLFLSRFKFGANPLSV